MTEPGSSCKDLRQSAARRTGRVAVWTGYVASVPIRAADGLWYVAVMVYGGVELHPVDNLVRC